MAACKTRHFGSLPFLFPPQSLPLSPIHASTFARAQLFSTNACQLVKSVQSSRNRREANASQPSLKVISKEAMKEELPMDFGLLPMFIMPSGDRLPSLVYSTKDRLQLEWKRLKARFNDLRGRLAYKYYISRKPRPKLYRRGLSSEAKDLQQIMYRAFFNRDLTRLEKLCCEGLFASFRTRMSGMPPNTRHDWSIVYTNAPKLVANVGVYVPVPGVDKKMGLRQVVVRIDSKQKVDKITTDRSGRGKREEGIPKPVTEYVVIQKRLIENQPESEWMIWGTTEESSPEIDNATPLVTSGR